MSNHLSNMDLSYNLRAGQWLDVEARLAAPDLASAIETVRFEVTRSQHIVGPFSDADEWAATARIDDGQAYVKLTYNMVAV